MMELNSIEKDSIVKAIEAEWNKLKSVRDIVLHTGKGGAIMHQVEYILMFEKNVTEERRKQVRNEVEASKIWEDGLYEISTINGIKYLGLSDDRMPDGTILMKDDKGIWRVEVWKDKFRTNYKVVSEEEANKILKDSGAKLIEL